MDSSLKIAVILTAFDKMSSIVNSAVNKSQAKLKTLSDSADKIAKNAFAKGRDLAAMGLTTAAPVIGAVKEAMAFQDKMADVRKQMANDSPEFLKRMEADIFNLARTIPIATGEILDMAAGGMRMGIAQEKIVGYTQDVAKMAIALDMVPAEISENMGKIANVFNIPIQNIMGLADAVNKLDDSMAIKGSQVVETLLKIGGTSKYLRPNDAAALSAAMVALGETSDTAGTAINAVFNRLGAATMHSARFQKGLQMLGLSASDVQKRMSNRATAQNTIIDVLGRINKLDPSKQNEVLSRLFGLEHGPKLAKITNSIKVYEDALKMVQGKEKGSINNEYQKRIATATAKWQMFKNRVKEVAITAGNTLLPTFTKLIIQSGKIIEKVAAFINQHPALVAGIGKSIAVFSALSFAGSGLSFMIGGVAKAFSIGVSVFTGVTKAITFVGNAFKILRFIMMANPVVAIVAAVAFAAYMLIKHWDKVKAFFTRLWAGVKTIFNGALKLVKGYLLNFTPPGLIYKHWDKISAFFVRIWNAAKQPFIDAWNWVKGFGKNFYDAGANILKMLWDGIKSMAMKPVEAIKDVVKKIRDHLPFSPAKVGPLRDIHRVKLIETIAEGIKPASLVNKMQNVLRFAMDPFNNTRATMPAHAGSIGGGASFSFNITVNGGASKDDGQNIATEIRKQFERLIKDHKAQQARVSF